MKKLLLGTMFLFVAAFSACKKTNLKEADKPRNPNLPIMALEYEDWPEIENGMLVFRDDEHYEDYENLLNEATTIDQASSGGDQDPNHILEAIEGDLSFTSLRHITQEAFDDLNETGWATLAEIPDVHFINDLATKSILNSNADVQIGDKITHYISRDFAATIDASDASLLGALHALDESASIEDIIALQEQAADQTIEIRALGNAEISAQAKSTGIPYTINDANFRTPDPCNHPEILQIDGLNMTVLVSSPNPAIVYTTSKFEINWGDGSSPTTHYSNSGYYLNGATHTYSTPAQYTITVKGQGQSISSGLPWDDQRSWVVNVPNTCNYQAQRSLPKDAGNFHYFTDGGVDYAYGAKIWVEQYQQNGNYKHKVGSQTWCFKKSGGNWSTHEAQRVVAQFQIATYSNTCSSAGTESSGTWPSNTTNADANKIFNNYMGWFKVVSNHRVTINSTERAFDLETYVCP